MFTKKRQSEITSPERPEVRRGRGRPRGSTEQGIAARQRLYRTAIKLIASRGYEATTLRDIASKAGVSVGLLYKYYPSKRAVVLALYDELSADYAARAAKLKPDTWGARFSFALRTSLDVLAPHRDALSALLPVLVGTQDEGLFAPATGLSRERVQAVFGEVAAGATDAPKAEDDSAALGRVLYVVHLAVILWWLIDKSPEQTATSRLVEALERLVPMASLALRLKLGRAWLQVADELCRRGLFGEGAERT